MRIALVFSLLLVLVSSVALPRADGETSSTKTFLESHTLSLSDARRIAFSHNWDLLAAKSNIDMAAAQKIVAAELPNPEISVSVSGINIDDHPNTYERAPTGIQQSVQDLTLPSGETIRPPLGTTRRNGFWQRTYDTEIAVSQLLELGGKRRYRKESAQAGLEAAEAQFRDARRLLDTEVVKEYTSVLLADTKMRTLNDSVESVRKEAQLAAIREQAGDISVTDRTQIEMMAERLEADARSAEAEAATARISLLVLLGVAEPNASWEPSDSLESLAALPAPIEPKTLDQRPDMIAAVASLKKAEAEYRGQQALRIPDPTVSLSYEHEPPDGPNSIGLGVSIPVPLWHRYTGEIRTADAARRDATREVDQVRARIRAECDQALMTYMKAVERWTNYRDTIQPKSARIRENISFAYARGGASLLDLLSAQRTDNEVRQDTAQAAADSVVALADLASAYDTELNTESENAK